MMGDQVVLDPAMKKQVSAMSAIPAPGTGPGTELGVLGGVVV